MGVLLPRTRYIIYGIIIGSVKGGYARGRIAGATSTSLDLIRWTPCQL